MNCPSPEFLVDLFLARKARTVEDMSGYRTLVSEKPAKGIQTPSGDTTSHLPGESPRSDRDRANPQPTDTKENLERHPPGSPSYTRPNPSGQSGGSPKVRTPGTPGEEYGHPYKENITPRRTAEAPSYAERQRKQKGDSKRYYERYYRRHKGKIKSRAERAYKKVKTKPSFQRQKKLRNDPRYEDRFKRLPAGGYSSPADRSQDYRDKHAATAPTFWYEPLGEGSVVAIDGPSVIVRVEGDMYEIDFLEFLGDAVFDDQASVDAFFEMTDQAFGEAPSAVRVASFYYEIFTQGDNMDPGDGVMDRGTPTFDDHSDRVPAESMNNIREVDQGGSSAKVIPDSSDITTKKASSIRVAARMSEIMANLDPGIDRKAMKVRPKLQRSDPTNDIYTFSVPGSKGDKYAVKVKVIRQGNVTDPGKADIQLSCSCDFWRWQGPEHHAKVGGYLYGNPEGSASSPTEKDPSGTHRVCKHARAVLAQVQKWSLGPRRR